MPYADRADTSDFTSDLILALEPGKCPQYRPVRDDATATVKVGQLRRESGAMELDCVDIMSVPEESTSYEPSNES